MSIPIRLNDELLKQAKKQIKLSLRSMAKQIEFWAQIGKEAETNMTPADVMALINGEAEIKIFRKKSNPVDLDEIMNDIESDRKSGALKSKVIKDKVWYEENEESPGLFYRVTSDGKRTAGKFIDGKFKAVK